MGWFWADTAPAAPSPRTVAPHPMPRGDATPPPGCPMHIPNTEAAAPPPPPPNSACPYVPPEKSATSTQPHDSSQGTLSKLNPLNYMPFELSQKPSAEQTIALPVSREPSSIPRGGGLGNWEYPSPQQMYNAMLRKGYDDTPVDAVESMVAVHNFLNEGAWAEIVEWERRFGQGLSRGWKECAQGEDGTQASATLGAVWTVPDAPQPSLVRFMGRPGDLTPKARMLQVLAWVYPQKFETEPPFDRHDWFVRREDNEGNSKEVRYVIDYYSAPPEPTGEPVFFLDVRPAVDTPSAAVARLMRWSGDVWWRASGGTVRAEIEKARAAGR